MRRQTAQIKNKSIFLRWVADDFEVFEEFLGLYHTDSIDAASITFIITDLLQRFNLSIGKLCGQCYDGYSAMSGSPGLLQALNFNNSDCSS